MPITTLCVVCWTKHVCMYETHLLFQPSLKIMRHSKNGTYRSFIHTKLNTKRVPLFSSYNFFSMHNFRVGGGLTLQFQLGSNLKPTALSGIYSTYNSDTKKMTIISHGISYQHGNSLPKYYLQQRITYKRCCTYKGPTKE